MQNMFGKNLCSINIDLDKVYISYDNAENDVVVKKTKFISLDDFISSIKNINTSLSTPLLPNGCLAYNKSGNTAKYTMFSPSCRTTLAYRTGSGSSGVTKFDNAFFPSFIMVATFNQGLGYCYIYMIDSNIKSPLDLTNDTILYRMPFPNVYHDNKICWGSNFGSDLAITQRNCGLLLDIFKNSTFNFDLFGETFRTIQQKLSVSTMEDYFRYLVSATEWPSDVLISTDLKLGGVI